MARISGPPSEQPEPRAGPSKSVKPTGEPEEPRGLACRKCGCSHFWTIRTKPAMGGGIKRRKECRNCGRQITTRENPI